MLPRPSDAEKFLYANPGKYYYWIAALVFVLTAIVGLVNPGQLHALPAWGLAIGAINVVYLGLSFLLGIFSPPFDRARHEALPAIDGTVDVFLPVCGEDLATMRNTWEGVRDIDWDVKVYVLDDRAQPEVEAMAAEFGFNYLVRPDRPHLKKAGNLRYGFSHSDGQYILVLDADFRPHRDIIKELLPYFGDEKIAIIQTPQYFPVDDTVNYLQKGAGYVQELFYRLIQPARSHWGAAVCCGSNAVYRRSALAPFGGSAAIEHSEDVHTGIQCLRAGWKVLFVPVILAKGVCPDTARQFFSQQYRWCLGSLTLFTSKFFWSTPMSLGARAFYISGQMYYIATSLFAFTQPLFVIVSSWVQPDALWWCLAVAYLPGFVMERIVLRYWSKAPFGSYFHHARNLASYAHVFAILDRLRKTEAGWSVSGVKETSGKLKSSYDSFRNLMIAWPLIVLALSIWSGIVHPGLAAAAMVGLAFIRVYMVTLPAWRNK